MEQEKKLSEDLKSWRADRPDEWTMDRFIRKAIALESQVEKPSAQEQPNAVDAYCRCKYPWPPATNKFNGMVCDACGKKRTTD